jgi:hypothetical protein
VKEGSLEKSEGDDDDDDDDSVEKTSLLLKSKSNLSSSNKSEGDEGTCRHDDTMEGLPSHMQRVGERRLDDLCRRNVYETGWNATITPEERFGVSVYVHVIVLWERVGPRCHRCWVGRQWGMGVRHVCRRICRKNHRIIIVTSRTTPHTRTSIVHVPVGMYSNHITLSMKVSPCVRTFHQHVYVYV